MPKLKLIGRGFRPRLSQILQHEAVRNAHLHEFLTFNPITDALIKWHHRTAGMNQSFPAAGGHCPVLGKGHDNSADTHATEFRFDSDLSDLGHGS